QPGDTVLPPQHIAVSLKWITPDAERVIVECARVSSDPSKPSRPDADLLEYLIRNRHWSPFEMASACVEVLCPRDISRQLIRHRSFSFQEFSQRYSSVDLQQSPGPRSARLQHPTNRQASLSADNQPDLREWWNAAQTEQEARALAFYREALHRGIAKEVARSVLPEGLTQSRLFMSGTIRSWIHFIDVRTSEGTQAEMWVVAQQVRALLSEHMWVTMGVEV
ncbi:MAG: FAD-dependent thymidylate synthase, partial [Pseudomonadota bacterium]